MNQFFYEIYIFLQGTFSNICQECCNLISEFLKILLFKNSTNFNKKRHDEIIKYYKNLKRKNARNTSFDSSRSSLESIQPLRIDESQHLTAGEIPINVTTAAVNSSWGSEITGVSDIEQEIGVESSDELLSQKSSSGNEYHNSQEAGPSGFTLDSEDEDRAAYPPDSLAHVGPKIRSKLKRKLIIKITSSSLFTNYEYTRKQFELNLPTHIFFMCKLSVNMGFATLFDGDLCGSKQPSVVG